MEPGKIREDFSLKPGEVHVWVMDLDHRLEGDLLRWEGVLSSDENLRARSYKAARDRQRFIAGRGILRELLAEYTGMAPASIQYVTNPYGKLSLLSFPLAFNNANSQGWAAYAFTLQEHIGIDLEQMRPLPDSQKLAKAWFSRLEQAEFFNLPGEIQQEAFYHIWTQKEAFIKAQGLGLSLSLEDFSVFVDPHRPAGLLNMRNRNVNCWRIVSRTVQPDLRIAICVAMEADPQVIWHMD